MQPFIFIAVFICGIMIGARATLAMTTNEPPNVQKVIALMERNNQLKDYQIELTLDSAYLYDNDKLIGATAHGKDGIDSLIMMDNQ